MHYAKFTEELAKAREAALVYDRLRAQGELVADKDNLATKVDAAMKAYATIYTSMMAPRRTGEQNPEADALLERCQELCAAFRLKLSDVTVAPLRTKTEILNDDKEIFATVATALAYVEAINKLQVMHQGDMPSTLLNC